LVLTRNQIRMHSSQLPIFVMFSFPDLRIQRLHLWTLQGLHPICRWFTGCVAMVFQWQGQENKTQMCLLVQYFWNSTEDMKWPQLVSMSVTLLE